MASYFLAPIGNDSPFFLSTGVPASGAKLFTYTAGSTTKTNTYQDNAGNTLNANPILLNSSGYPASGGSVVEIWLISGTNYKFVLAPSTDSDPPASPYWTRDNISGVNDVSATVSEWQAGPTPTYVSATQFTLVGDQTGTFQVGRRLKTTNTAGTIYSRISVSAFTSLTTVTVVNDSGTLDSGLSSVSYSLISATNPSLSTKNLQDISAGTTASTFTWNGTGGTSASITLTWQIIGKMVTLKIPAVVATSGTSSTALVGDTALPAAIRPPTATQVAVIASFVNSGGVVATPGVVSISTAGVVSIFRDATGATVTNSTSCGTNSDQTIAFSIAA